MELFDYLNKDTFPKPGAPSSPSAEEQVGSWDGHAWEQLKDLCGGCSSPTATLTRPHPFTPSLPGQCVDLVNVPPGGGVACNVNGVEFGNIVPGSGRKCGGYGAAWAPVMGATA